MLALSASVIARAAPIDSERVSLSFSSFPLPSTYFTMYVDEAEASIASIVSVMSVISCSRPVNVNIPNPMVLSVDAASCSVTSCVSSTLEVLTFTPSPLRPVALSVSALFVFAHVAVVASQPVPMWAICTFEFLPDTVHFEKNLSVAFFSVFPVMNSEASNLVITTGEPS